MKYKYFYIYLINKIIILINNFFYIFIFIMNYKYKYDKYKMKYIEKLKKVGGNNDYNELKTKIENLLNYMNEFNEYLNSNFKNDVNLTVLYENNNKYIENLNLFYDNINNKYNIINILNKKYNIINNNDYILKFFILIITELNKLNIDFFNYINLDNSIIDNYDLLVYRIINFIYKINLTIIKNNINNTYTYSTDPIFYYSNLTKTFIHDNNISRFNEYYSNLNYRNDSKILFNNDELKNIIFGCYIHLNNYLTNFGNLSYLTNNGKIKLTKKKHYENLNEIIQFLPELNENNHFKILMNNMNWKTFK